MKKLFLSLILTTAAFAGTLSLTGLPEYQAGGHYVGPADSNFGPVVCRDFDLMTLVPSSFDVETLTPTSFTDRVQAAIFAVLMTHPEWALNNYIVGSYQFAIWNAKDTNFADFGYSDTILALYSNPFILAQVDISNVVIYQPTDTDNQSFMGFRDQGPGTNQVPEPATYGMLGLGLVCLGYLKRK